MALDGRPWSLDRLLEYARIAEGAGFRALSANDHLVYGRPWLDGPTALAAVLGCTGGMGLATTVALPVVRGPVALAKSMAAIDILSGGRLVVGVGPGSSARDYDAASVPFEERWKRLDEAVGALRALWCEDGRHLRQLLFDRRHAGRAAAVTATGSSDMDRQLGLRSRPPSDGRPVWATAGSPPPTTRHQKRSPTRSLDSENT